jgi:hypothetical protein
VQYTPRKTQHNTPLLTHTCQDTAPTLQPIHRRPCPLSQFIYTPSPHPNSSFPMTESKVTIALKTGFSPALAQRHARGVCGDPASCPSRRHQRGICLPRHGHERVLIPFPVSQIKTSPASFFSPFCVLHATRPRHDSSNSCTDTPQHPKYEFQTLSPDVLLHRHCHDSYVTRDERDALKTRFFKSHLSKVNPPKDPMLHQSRIYQR